MNLSELQSTLVSAVASGKIGTPVSLRVHAVVAEDSLDPATFLDRISGWGATVFKAEPVRLTARVHATGRQWNILLNYPGGQKALITLASSPATAGDLHLVLVGNHGMVRLEGGESFDTSPEATIPRAEFWQQRLTASHAQNGPVDLDE